jgi:hypothetical protein
MCVRERVLTDTGDIDTVLLDERYLPYTYQAARIENLCGSFTEYVQTAGLANAVSQTSGQRELFHLHGNLVINQGRGAFLAVRGMSGLEHLAKVLRLSSPSNVVHMVVLTSKIGKRAQVSSAGLLESSLHRRKDSVRVTGRIYEHTNSVGFTLRRFEKLPFFIPREYQPDSNDWTVTGKGMVIIRLVWSGLAWTQEVEDACLTLCNNMTEWLQACC